MEVARNDSPLSFFPVMMISSLFFHLFQCSSLRLRWLDAYLIHWPVPARPDGAEAPIGETWGQLESLVKDGYVKVIGVSNFSRKKVDNILSQCTIRPSLVQVECHPYWRQENMLAWCHEKGIHMTAYSALGSPDSESLLNRSSHRLMDDPVVQDVSSRTKREKGQVRSSKRSSFSFSLVKIVDNSSFNLLLIGNAGLDKVGLATTARLQHPV